MLRICCAIVALAAPLAVAAPLQRSNSDAGTTYLGALADLDWGRPVASGDLDGDGYDEIIIGASEPYGGFISRVYVLRGGPGAHGRGAIDLSTTAADQVILGAAVDDNLGCSIATGDVNGDGIADLLICASNASYGGVEYRGIAYLIYGGPNFFASGTRDLSLSGQWDVRFLGPVADGDMGGNNMFGGLDAHAAAIGRLDSDAYGDVVLGVHLATGGASGSGSVFVVFGLPFPSGATVNLAVPSNYGVRINGRGEYDQLGEVVLTADLTGDGLDELILPNEYASKGLFTSEGATYILRGRTRPAWNAVKSYNLATLPANITLWGAREDDNLGVAAAAGDFNGDGLADLAVAAPGADAGAWDDQIGEGFVYGLLGSQAYQTGTYSRDYATATPDFKLVGEFQEGLGMEVSAGDFNGDGIDDIAAAEWFAGPETNGVVEVLFGRPFAPGATYTANVDTDLHIVGAANDRIGFSLGAADVNGDGLREIVYGTPFNNSDRGTVYVFTYVSGDPDHDGDHDLADFARLQGCFIGPDERTTVGPCVLLDFDLDEDVDMADFTAWVPLMAGPG
jgi:hypothetical protein